MTSLLNSKKAVLSVLIMGMACHGSFFATISQAETFGVFVDNDFAEELKNRGTRRPFDIETRKDLEPSHYDAQIRADQIQLGCEAVANSEIEITIEETSYIGGYEFIYDCVDAPTPGIGFYYDIHQNYLGAIDLSPQY